MIFDQNYKKKSEKNLGIIFVVFNIMGQKVGRKFSAGHSFCLNFCKTKILDRKCALQLSKTCSKNCKIGIKNFIEKKKVVENRETFVPIFLFLRNSQFTLVRTGSVLEGKLAKYILEFRQNIIITSSKISNKNNLEF